MKPISDKLFLFLTMNIVNNGRDIDDYINKKDGKIYLVKGRDNELYFIVNGSFYTTSANEIDYAKTDSCVFGRNSRTDKVTPIDTKKLKECIDEADVFEYAKELKEIFFNYISSKKIKNLEDLQIEFIKKVQYANTILQRTKHGDDEDLIRYAERITLHKQELLEAKKIIEVKDTIERLWIKILYEPDKKRYIESIIYKILLRIM